MKTLHYIRIGKWMLILLFKRLQASNTLDNGYAKSDILEEELSSAETQAVISNNYGQLQSAFSNFPNIFKKLDVSEKKN